MGLITTKLGELENPTDIRRRLDEVARFVPLEQLALSPQCGFASIVEGDKISVAQQRAKLELVVHVAQSVWGSA